LLLLVDFDALSQKVTDSLETSSEQTYKTYPAGYFELPVYDEDVTLDPVYQSKDRLIYVKVANETIALLGDAASYGSFYQLWQDYFDAVIAGDSSALQKLYTDSYLEKIGGQSDFAPQKVYNISVEVLMSQVLEDGDQSGRYVGYTVYYCKVSYCILDNNGTFRNDFFDDDVSVPLVFEVLEYQGEDWINNCSRQNLTTTSSSSTEGSVNFVMPIIWAVLIVVGLLVEWMTCSLVTIWFIPAGLVSLILSFVQPQNVLLQITLFVLLSVFFFILSRTVFKKMMKKTGYSRTNADRVISMIAVVTEPIDSIAGTGEVKVDGKRWSARMEDGKTAEIGARVRVLRIEGVKLICSLDENSSEEENQKSDVES
jgi:membrane protein implicated in regulation of membrane protease activity